MWQPHFSRDFIPTADAEASQKRLQEDIVDMRVKLDTIGRLNGLPASIPEAVLSDQALECLPPPNFQWLRDDKQRRDSRKEIKKTLSELPHLEDWPAPLETKRPEVLSKLKEQDKFQVTKMIPSQFSSTLVRMKHLAVIHTLIDRDRTAEAGTECLRMLDVLMEDLFTMVEQQRSLVYKALGQEHMDPAKQVRQELLPETLTSTLKEEAKLRAAIRSGSSNDSRQQGNARRDGGGRPFRKGNSNRRSSSTYHQRNNSQNSSNEFRSRGGYQRSSFQSSRSRGNSNTPSNGKGSYQGKNYDPNYASKRQRQE
jgi:hypothetical protein